MKILVFLPLIALMWLINTADYLKLLLLLCCPSQLLFRVTDAFWSFIQTLVTLMECEFVSSSWLPSIPYLSRDCLKASLCFYLIDTFVHPEEMKFDQGVSVALDEFLFYLVKFWSGYLGFKSNVLYSPCSERLPLNLLTHFSISALGQLYRSILIRREM